MIFKDGDNKGFVMLMKLLELIMVITSSPSEENF